MKASEGRTTRKDTDMDMSKEQLHELFWKINGQAKREGDGSSPKQFRSLKAILDGYDDATIEALGAIEREYRSAYQGNPEYDLMHWSRGGFIQTGDDGFYMDFGSWLVAQGKDLFDAFQEEGREAIIRYIRENGFTEEDYHYESMCYAYNRF